MALREALNVSKAPLLVKRGEGVARSGSEGVDSAEGESWEAVGEVVTVSAPAGEGVFASRSEEERVGKKVRLKAEVPLPTPPPVPEAQLLRLPDRVGGREAVVHCEIALVAEAHPLSVPGPLLAVAEAHGDTVRVAASLPLAGPLLRVTLGVTLNEARPVLLVVTLQLLLAAAQRVLEGVLVYEREGAPLEENEALPEGEREAAAQREGDREAEGEPDTPLLPLGEPEKLGLGLVEGLPEKEPLGEGERELAKLAVGEPVASDGLALPLVVPA